MKAYYLTLAILAGFVSSAPLHATDDAKKSSQKSAAQADDKKEEKPKVAEKDSPKHWPTQVPAPEKTRLRQLKSKEGEGFVYETLNFQFSSEVELSEEAQESVGRLFECAYAAVVAMSRSLPIERATRKRPANNKFKAVLYKDMQSYYAAGARAGSAGLYSYNKTKMSGKLKESHIFGDKVMVPFPSLGLNPEGGVRSKNIRSHVLVHEITHQFTVLNNLPVWANEGLSEYAGYIPYDNGVLDFDKCLASTISKARYKKLNFPFSLDDFFKMSQKEMYAYQDKGIDTYYLSLLCVSYFVHLAEEVGVRNFQSYLRELLRGKDNDKSVPKLYGRVRKPELFEEEFLKTWAAKGIKIQFAEPAESNKK